MIEITLSPELSRLIYLCGYLVFFHLPMILLTLACWAGVYVR